MNAHILGRHSNRMIKPINKVYHVIGNKEFDAYVIVKVDVYFYSSLKLFVTD